MEAIKFLTITARKLKGGNQESDWRSSASRSYYAVFHYIRDVFQNSGLDLIKGDTHNLPQYFYCSSDIEIKTIGQNIQSLYRYRARADYEIKLEFMKNDSQKAYILAELLIEQFDKMFRAKKREVIDSAQKFISSKNFKNN